jgi:fatty-acyl-CoA synthase
MPILRTLPEALAEAARAGDGYYFLADGHETFRSYADVRGAACRFARALVESGLHRGDLVGLVLNDAEAFLTALMGASMAGVVPASMHPPAAVGDLTRFVDLTAGILRSSAARAVVTERALLPHFDAVRAACPALSLVLAREDLDAPASDPPSHPSLDDIALVQFTSGSTSAPKGVVLTHRNLAANIEAINGPAGLGLAQGDVGVSWLPLNHDMGLVGMALTPVYASLTGVLMPPAMFVKRPVEWLRAITRFRGTISFAPHFAYDLCLRRVKDRDLEGLDLSRWRAAGCGAEPIYPPTFAAFAARFAPVGFRDTSFFPCYGLAEHVLAATLPVRDRLPRIDTAAVLAPSGSSTEDRAPLPRAAREVAGIPLVGCGRALPGHEVRIVDEADRPLPDRCVGEIALKGPSVMMGYYNRDTLTAGTIRDGWLHTGDLGYLSDGELFVSGRAKDVIIVNGRKHHPQDLEWAVGDLPGVRRGRVAAFGIDEPGRPDRVVVVVEPSGTVRADDLVAGIRRRIGDVFGLYVDEVAIVPSGTVGRTTSGKVQRSATKARYVQGDFSAATVEG